MFYGEPRCLKGQNLLILERVKIIVYMKKGDKNEV